MNRIDQIFQKLRQQRKKAFIAFLTAGDPDLKKTEELVLSFEKVGVDIVELGVPFSDPLADGPTIQEASYRSLQKKTTLRKILALVKKIREKSEIPLCLMTYYNPVFCFGSKKFIREAKKSGVDGLIIPDLPPEEDRNLVTYARNNDISTIFFLTPTTTRQRRREVIKKSTGFIYYVSLKGVTGVRTFLPSNLARNVRAAKKMTQKPVCVGFGISQPGQAKAIKRIADGVIVGSAIVKQIERNSDKRNMVKKVSVFVRKLAAAH